MQCLMERWTARTEVLLGSDSVEKLRLSTVLVVGLGGVGSAAAEMLARAGVGHFVLVDGDVVTETNLNRQLVALHSTLGLPKAVVAASRLKDINPLVETVSHACFLAEEDMEWLFSTTQVNFVVDAIDTLAPKLALLTYCLSHGLPVMASMGSGGRRDPSLISGGRYFSDEPVSLGKSG
jgi:tRNA A37 threonylcarbamoyladenosine dehydratase